ncbi:glycoside hydrolase family 71 protein [Mariannaea sp. PMI_226]|nr:glycoside hydrolase family 71 protein [Mariannaea sp. PMI_226]
MRSYTLLALASLLPEALCAAHPRLRNRAVANQGWSLVSATCPANSKSCGGSACCPSSSNCQTTGNGEVMACCPTTSNCRGSVEGNPTCADPAWSLWKGQFGNGFCCQVGQVGAYRSGDATAGVCGSSVPSGYTAAQLVTTGTGSGTPPSSTTSSSSSSTSSSATSSSTGSPSGRKVFAHYMVGTMTQAEAVKDVQDAKNAGFDGFALNTHTITDSWATDAIGWLFDAADANSFNLFISFDMSWGIYQVADIPAFLTKYTSHKSYYRVNNKPFVSTFWGGSKSSDEWNNNFRQVLQNSYGITPFFVPSFDDMSGYPNGLVSKFGNVIDGALSWEAAWPAPGNSPASVSSATDQNVMQQLGSKAYMMALSPLQFKYSSDGKWYRSGELNLPTRMEQILSLKPQFVEFLTWNDAGESHYIGNIFPEAISGNTDIHAYTDGFSHVGWQQLVKPFIKAYTSGATSASQILPPGNTPVGSLWYRTVLAGSSCTDSAFQNHGQAQDVINFAVLLPSSSYTVKVYSNNNLIGTFPGTTGLFYKSVSGLQAGGNQRIEVWDSGNNKVASAIGTKNVQASSSGCNWNYEVVGLS